MNAIGRLFRNIRFIMGEPAYSFVMASDRRWLLKQLRNIMVNSREYLYLSLTSRPPLLLGDDFRDMILNTLYVNQGKLDFRILIRKGWSRSLGFYDASFRVTDKSIGNFLIGDGGALVLVIWPGERFDIRRPYPDEDVKVRFLKACETASLGD